MNSPGRGRCLTQARFQTDSTAGEYVTRDEHLDATRPRPCPLCEDGDCVPRRHGWYERKDPPGVRVPRFLCPRSGGTVSLLPDFCAARASGMLERLEKAGDAVERTAVRAAADRLRPPGDVGLAAAERWTRRRKRWTQGVLQTVKGLLPERLAGTEPTLAAFRGALDCKEVLRELRDAAEAHLRATYGPEVLSGRRRWYRSELRSSRTARSKAWAMAARRV